jgi:hypothetical protein
VHASCHADALPLQPMRTTVRVDVRSSTSEQISDLDLGHEVMTVRSSMHRSLRRSVSARFIVETSLDQTTWTPAWQGVSPDRRFAVGSMIRYRFGSSFPTLSTNDPYIPAAASLRANYNWVISELEVWSSNTGVPE